jgi:micrococcal nuclease
MEGFQLKGTVDAVTDGDTVRIAAEGVLFKTRVLGLDTEEARAGGGKPKTPWGVAASDFLKDLLPAGTAVTMEFPGVEPALVDGEINVNYLDNYERPLAHVLLDEPADGLSDLSEIMIRRGFSPYFVKYGRALRPDLDRRYAEAERAAQRDDLGVWNQFAANGVIRPEDAPRNYARLSVWWELRARLIDGFRAVRAARPEAPIFDTRLDYATLVQRAEAGETVTVFMEMTQGRTVGGTHFAMRSGSLAQPFQLFMPDEDRPEIVAVKRLLENRYVASGEDFPRLNYAYVTGSLRLYRGAPEMLVEDVSQITDEPPSEGDG